MYYISALILFDKTLCRLLCIYETGKWPNPIISEECDTMEWQNKTKKWKPYFVIWSNESGGLEIIVTVSNSFLSQLASTSMCSTLHAMQKKSRQIRNALWKMLAMIYVQLIEIEIPSIQGERESIITKWI